GSCVSGFEMRHYDTGLWVYAVGNVLIEYNRMVSNFGSGMSVKDTDNVEVRYNQFIDPYLPADKIGNLTDAMGDAQMDYGISVYGSLNPSIHHNYFFGVFNQALSFKNSNINAYAAFNTFEGAALTAILVGQENDHDGEDYPRYHRTGWERGNIIVRGNVFRPIKAPHLNGVAEYRVRTPLRLWQIDASATVEVADNVVEASLEGFRIECGEAPHADRCVRAPLNIHHNTFNSRIVDAAGVTRYIGNSCAIGVMAGVPAAVSLSNNTLTEYAKAICTSGMNVRVENNVLYSNGAGIVGTTAYTAFNTFNNSGAASGLFATTEYPQFRAGFDFNIRGAEPVLGAGSPMACPFSLSPGSPTATNSSTGSYRGAYGVGLPCM
ncbi:MAG TPA: right-handed parallel beta-helix repeat-containing protein, partial [Burkholderiaceae bacterium]